LNAVSLAIHVSEETATLLTRQAAAHGKSLEAWIERLVREKTQTEANRLNDGWR
jgi:predicted HicB family RNase H-like nuclease